MWSLRWPITADTPVARYLAKRGYTGVIPATLAYLPPRKQHGPTMIAAFGIGTEVEPGVIAAPNEITGVHLTWLTPEGEKVGAAPHTPNKIMIGSCTGKPIVIAPPNDLLGMAVTEGIEDALSVYAATGLGVWAAGAAGFMPALASVVPDWIECATIYMHADDAGRKYAMKLAKALTSRGLEVLIEGAAP